jgi:hypothetical protein
MPLGIDPSQPGQRRPQVVVLQLELRRKLGLPLPAPRVHLLRSDQEVFGVPIPHTRFLSALAKPLEGVFPNGVEHPEAAGVLPEQALLEQ